MELQSKDRNYEPALALDYSERYWSSRFLIKPRAIQAFLKKQLSSMAHKDKSLVNNQMERL
jgi:hypothetical protein